LEGLKKEKDRFSNDHLLEVKKIQHEIAEKPLQVGHYQHFQVPLQMVIGAHEFRRTSHLRRQCWKRRRITYEISFK